MTTATEMLDNAGMMRQKSKFAGTCCMCSAHIDAGQGRVVRRSERNSWKLICRTVECTESLLDMQSPGNPATVVSIMPATAITARRDVGQWDGVAEEIDEG